MREDWQLGEAVEGRLGEERVSSVHSGKVRGVMWTLSFPDDFSFNLPLINHLLPIISKKYVWECQIFDI